MNFDIGCNEYGIKLLLLCKIIGFCIVNGRYKGGFVNDFFFNGLCGFSIIDYLLLFVYMFDCFYKFIVCNFNVFFDYVLLYIELYISMNNNLC